MYRTAGQQAAKEHAQSRARDSEERGFRQKQCKHGGARGADGAEDTDFRAAADHAHGNRVVDEEGSHHQRNVAEDAQVPAEGAEHALVLRAAGAGFFDQVRRRQRLPDGGFDAGKVFRG